MAFESDRDDSQDYYEDEIENEFENEEENKEENELNINQSSGSSQQLFCDKLNNDTIGVIPNVHNDIEKIDNPKIGGDQSYEIERVDLNTSTTGITNDENVLYIPNGMDVIRSKYLNLFLILEEDSDCFIDTCERFGYDIVLSARDRRHGFECRTLLHACCEYGLLIQATYLLRIGHDINVIDSSVSKVTPIIIAINYGHVEIVKALVIHGSNLSLLDNNNENIFHHVARSNNARVLKIILNNCSLSSSQLQKLLNMKSISRKKPVDVAIARSLCSNILKNIQEI